MEIEENILKTVIEKESWEEIIYFIVSKEKLDPWNIDLVKLTRSFVQFLRQASELDFRIPAKVVFVAALLLRLKAEYLAIFEEEEEKIKEEKIEKVEIPEIEFALPIKRFPKRQVTLDELIKALRKALEIKERKEKRKRLIFQQLAGEIVISEDISIKMNKLLEEIKKLMENFGREKIRFKEIVRKWERDEIINKFFPLLHLDHQRKINIEQENFFDEIWISKIK